MRGTIGPLIAYALYTFKSRTKPMYMVLLVPNSCSSCRTPYIRDYCGVGSKGQKVGCI